ncbi:MAG TPA: POTRA domain-containing protein [Candidatus Binataceae bacterium]|nr:POTRA domain-containing protein [Candidatus Binataceae bacterium]
MVYLTIIHPVNALRHSIVGFLGYGRRRIGPATSVATGHIEQFPGSIWKRILVPLALVQAWLLFAGYASAQGPYPIVAEIQIEGNQRIESDAIRVHISQPAGHPFDPDLVNKDVKAIYKMGFFDSVTSEFKKGTGNIVLIYKVKERPLVSEVRFNGIRAKLLADDRIIAAVKIHSGGLLDFRRVEETISGIRETYEKEGYLDVKVTFRSIVKPENTVIAVFDVAEGPKIRIGSIDFTGNAAYSSAQLRSVISDATNPEQVEDHLTTFYYDNGHLDVHIEPPKVVRDGNALNVTIAVYEGPLYRYGSITIAGRPKLPPGDPESILTIKNGEAFSKPTLRQNVLALSDFYSNRGYAFVNIDPRTRLDSQRHVIDVTFYVTPGHEILIDRINIKGNVATPENVIRRELRIQEHQLYCAREFSESKVRLDRLGLFSETRITTESSTRPNEINVNVIVTEKDKRRS